jgi:hypothetical protein
MKNQVIVIAFLVWHIHSLKQQDKNAIFSTALNALQTGKSMISFNNLHIVTKQEKTKLSLLL